MRRRPFCSRHCFGSFAALSLAFSGSHLGRLLRFVPEALRLGGDPVPPLPDVVRLPLQQGPVQGREAGQLGVQEGFEAGMGFRNGSHLPEDGVPGWGNAAELGTAGRSALQGGWGVLRPRNRGKRPGGTR